MTPSGHSFQLHNGQMGAAITVRVVPRASKNEIVEIGENGTIKIRLTAPPVEGQANNALIEFLADVLDVAKSKVEIIGGLTGRDKLVSILGVDAETVHKKIVASLAR